MNKNIELQQIKEVLQMDADKDKKDAICLSIMNTYAATQAVEFAKWIEDNFILDGTGIYIDNTLASKERYTTEQLYEIYLKQQEV